MKIKEIESFIDCSLVIMYGTEEEFVQWLAENDVNDVSRVGKDGMGGPIARDGQYVHCVWVRRNEEISEIQAIATLASQASRLADNIDKYVCGESRTGLCEKIPPELRARVIGKVVRVGAEMILEKEVAA